MIDSCFLNLLNSLGYGCTLLDHNFKIGDTNRWFRDFADSRTINQGMSIVDILPELYGLENVFREIISGKHKNFKMQNLQRENKNQIHYFNFDLFPSGNDNYPLICLIKDVSESALQQQTLNQQKYEIALLENLLSRRSTFLSSSILGESEQIRKIQKTVEKLSNIPNASVLLLGESGTGKNLIANVIHYSSQISNSPFVEINCAAIPESLLESELFGYEKGAFTNAHSMRKGLIEEANGGTLFLDEIGELPLKTQAKLLSFLESRKFRRLGSNHEHEVSLRLITATNRDLSEMVEDGLFREDLLFRLNVVSITLPPLRELGDDIIIIANHFRQVFNVEFKKNVKKFSSSATDKLLTYSWPGNVRELRNTIEKAMIFIESSTISNENIVFGYNQKNVNSNMWEVPSQGINLEELEKTLIKSALEKTKGNKTKAARLLGLTRDTLRYRLEKHELY